MNPFFITFKKDRQKDRQSEREETDTLVTREKEKTRGTERDKNRNRLID